jgi:hypothetical protein
MEMTRFARTGIPVRAAGAVQLLPFGIFHSAGQGSFHGRMEWLGLIIGCGDGKYINVLVNFIFYFILFFIFFLLQMFANTGAEAKLPRVAAGNTRHSPSLGHCSPSPLQKCAVQRDRLCRMQSPKKNGKKSTEPWLSVPPIDAQSAACMSHLYNPVKCDRA